MLRFVVLAICALLLLLCAAPAGASNVIVDSVDSYDTVSEAVGGITDTDPHTLTIVDHTVETDMIEIGDKEITITTTGNYRIQRDTSLIDVPLFVIEEGSLTLTTASGGTLTIDGQKVKIESSDYDGGLIYVLGTLTIGDGVTLTNGNATIGGAVYVDGGTFSMTGGTITGNSADSGGGVYVYDGGEFVMSGGTITGNTASTSGGGVHVEYEIGAGIFKMAGSAIISTDNDVYLKSGGQSIYTNITLSAAMNPGSGALNITPDGEGSFGIGMPIVYGNGNSVSTANFRLNPKYEFALAPKDNNLVLCKKVVLDGHVEDKDKGYDNVSAAVKAITDTDPHTLEIYGSTEEPASIAIDDKTVSITANAGSFRINRNLASGSLFTVGTGGSLTINATSSGSLTVDGENTPAGTTGGLVNVNGGRLTLEDGATLTHGNADTGAGVYLTSGSLIMSGGTITGNTATVGGAGVAVVDGMFTISGGANVTADNDVYLADGKNITLGSGGMNTGVGVFSITLADTFSVGDLIVDGTAASGGASTENFRLNPDVSYLLAQSGKNLVLAKAAVLNVGTGVKYATVYEAVEAIADSGSGTLKILDSTDEPQEITIGTKEVSITAEGNYWINRSTGFSDGNPLFTVGTGSLTINATSGGTLTVDGQNITTGTNGGLVNVNDGTLTLETGAVLTNGSASSGGGVYLTSGSLIMTGGTITGNTAPAGGAGVYLADGTFTISGGANVTADNEVYLTGGKNITLAAAMSAGGGVFNITPADSFIENAIIVDGATHRATASTENFKLNETYATKTGFDLKEDNSNLILSTTAPPSGNVKNLNTGDLYDNVSAAVKAITESGSGTLEILGSTEEPATIAIGTKKINITAAGNFRINRSTGFTSGSLFTINTGGSLAINATSGGTLTVDGQNIATGITGGLIHVTGGTLTLENGVTLTHGSASSGGGVYLTSGSLIMTGGIITGNTATAGAGVYLADGTFTISGGANVTADNDVYLADDKKIILAAAMAAGKGVFSITPAGSFVKDDIIVDGATHSVTASTENFKLNTTYAADTDFFLQQENNNLVLAKPAPAFPTITYDPANGDHATTEQLSEEKYNSTVPSAPTYLGYQLRGWYYYNGTQVYSPTARLVETILSTADHNLTALWYQNNSEEWSFTNKLTITYAAANNLTTVPIGNSITFGGGAQKITFNITDNMSAVAYADLVSGVHPLSNTSTNITIAGGDPSGLYTLTYTGFCKGDANLDGAVDILDASGLGIYTLNGAGFAITNEQKLHGDVTMDGQITVADVLAIHTHIAGGG